MTNKPLFSIILLHYNQPSYVKIALDSIFIQDYENLELIFADDCSQKIDVDDLKNYCENKKGSNITNIIWQINEQNVGTVKSLNMAVKKASGEHLLFFAADDALYNAQVISNFADAFDKADNDTYMISSQCTMMDINFTHRLETFINPMEGEKFSCLSAFEQYKFLTTGCFLAIGATAMRRDMFERFGYFNEEYKFTEDWSYYLNLTRRGGKIVYCNFDGLLHRDGGVSHSKAKKRLPKHVIAYRYDLVRIMENEIFPYLKDFSLEEKLDVLYFYNIHLSNYKITGERRKTTSGSKLYKFFGNSYIKYKVRQFLDFINIYFEKAFSVLINSFFLWASLNVLQEKFALETLSPIFDVLTVYVLPIIILIAAFLLVVSSLLLVLLKIKKIFDALRDSKEG